MAWRKSVPCIGLSLTSWGGLLHSTRIRQATAITIRMKDYVDSIAPPPQRLKDIQTASKRRGTNKLTIRQIDAEIAAARREQTKTQKVRLHDFTGP
jgi:hypothetical protein